MSYAPCLNPQCHSYGQPHPNCQCHSYAEGGAVENQDQEFSMGESGYDPQQTQGTPLPEAPAPESAPPAPIPEAPTNPQMPPPEAPPEEPQAPENPTMGGSPHLPVDPNSPIDANSLKQESANLKNDIANGYIQPKSMHEMLYGNKDTLGKIGSLFGLIVGGAGAGLSHQPNAVLEMMQKQIDNDLESQKQNVSNKQNLYKIYQNQQVNEAQIQKWQKEGVLNTAQAKAMNADSALKTYTLSKMAHNTLTLHALVEEVNKLPVGSPQRQQKEMVLAQMANVVDQNNSDLADRAAAQSAMMRAVWGANGQSQAGGLAGGNQNPEAQFQQNQKMLRATGNEKTADFYEDRHIPGVEGLASVKLTSQDRDKILSASNFRNELHKFIDYSEKNGGSVDPTTINYGKAMASDLQNAYREAMNGGVFKEGEQKFINSIITDDPTKFFGNLRIVPQLRAIQDQSNNRFHEMLKSKGFNSVPEVAKTDKPEAKSASKSQASSMPPDGTKGTANGRSFTWKNGKRIAD